MDRGDWHKDSLEEYCEGGVEAARMLLEGVVRLTGTDNLDVDACIDLIRQDLQDLRTRASTDDPDFNACADVVLRRLERVVRTFVEDQGKLRRLQRAAEGRPGEVDRAPSPRPEGQRDVYERFAEQIGALADQFQA